MTIEDLTEIIKDAFLISDFNSVSELDKIKSSMFAQAMAQSISSAIGEYVQHAIDERFSPEIL